MQEARTARRNILEITAALIKELREKTGVGMMVCKEALNETKGDFTLAVEYLRKKGIATAQKRSSRTTSEGQIQAYIHGGGKIGVLIEVNCETDFSGKSEDFTNFVKDVAMHIAATSPIAIGRDDVSAVILEKEKEIYAEQARESGKPEKIIDKIVEGKVAKFYEENCLLEQAFVKNPDNTIQDLLNDLIAKTGENIIIKRFVRFQLGDA